jgi:hypothetical protein
MRRRTGWPPGDRGTISAVSHPEDAVVTTHSSLTRAALSLAALALSVSLGGCAAVSIAASAASVAASAASTAASVAATTATTAARVTGKVIEKAVDLALPSPDEGFSATD